MWHYKTINYCSSLSQISVIIIIIVTHVHVQCLCEAQYCCRWLHNIIELWCLGYYSHHKPSFANTFVHSTTSIDMWIWATAANLSMFSFSWTVCYQTTLLIILIMLSYNTAVLACDRVVHASSMWNMSLMLLQHGKWRVHVFLRVKLINEFYCKFTALLNLHYRRRMLWSGRQPSACSSCCLARVMSVGVCVLWARSTAWGIGAPSTLSAVIITACCHRRFLMEWTAGVRIRVIAVFTVMQVAILELFIVHDNFLIFRLF